MNRPMHLSDRKLKTCKLMGSGGSEGTEGITFHWYIYHQRTELILLSHI